MKSIAAEPRSFSEDVAKISTYLDDMQNFKSFMPVQIEDWYAEKDSCSFFIKNLGKLAMKKGAVALPGRFEFPSDEKSKVSFTLVFHFQATPQSTPVGYFELIADINPMVEMMARRPLTNFVNIITENFQAVVAGK
ncbi:MAG: hypothetical protein K9H16_04295 [Bacteroidales bacterium]|nr:hypothetical protein [Bacteroidales bacterium]